MAASIVQGTNPKLSFKFADIVTSDISSFEMTLSNSKTVKLTKTTATYSGTDTATVQLTQTETLGLDPGNYSIQVRVKLTNGDICATPNMNLEVIKLNASSEI